MAPPFGQYKRPAIKVVIPSLGRAPGLPELLSTVSKDSVVDHVALYCNRNDRFSSVVDIAANISPDPVRCVSLPGRTIYQIWNQAIVSARKAGMDAIAILNDDIRLLSGSLTEMYRVLASDPDHGIVGATLVERLPERPPWLRAPDPSGFKDWSYVNGSFRFGGVPGFCFMVRPWVPLVDEQFEWWGGDDDLFFSTLQRGLNLIRHSGVPVEHVAETTAIHYPELGEAKARDRERLAAKWPGLSW